MFLRINDAVKGLKILPQLFVSLKEALEIQRKSLGFWWSNRKFDRFLRKNLTCSVSQLVTLYRDVGSVHVESPAHNGIFISKAHALEQCYPLIIAIDNNTKSYEGLELSLGSFFATSTLVAQSLEQTKNLKFSSLINSVALMFSLELLPSIEVIEEVLLNFRKQIDIKKDNAIFGAVILSESFSLSKKADQRKLKNYVARVEKDGKKYNRDLTFEQLDNLFNKLFEDVTFYKQGYCLLFTLSQKIQKVKRYPLLPKSDPLELEFDKSYY